MRKNIFFTIIALLCSVDVNEATAQSEVERYYPEGTVWTECWYTEDRDGNKDFSFMKYTVTQDTVIDGKTYQRVVMERKNSGTEDAENLEWRYDHTFHIRQDGKRVYYYRDGTYGGPQKEILRYDFSCSVGDQAPYLHDSEADEYGLYTISSIKPVTMEDGSVLDGIYFEFLPDILCQVSTIGCVDEWEGLFEIHGWYALQPYPQYYMVTSFTRNGVVLWKRNHEEILAVRETVLNRSDNDDTYTIEGVRIPSGQPQKPGIYIRNHKKLVIK